VFARASGGRWRDSATRQRGCRGWPTDDGASGEVNDGAEGGEYMA
jgi:hypothetical protein